MHYATDPRGRTREPSPRQLPTDHDHDGGLCPIHGYQTDQSSTQLRWPLLAPLFNDERDTSVNAQKRGLLEESFHISAPPST